MCRGLEQESGRETERSKCMSMCIKMGDPLSCGRLQGDKTVGGAAEI